MTQYRQVPESTAIYWPSTIKYQLFSLYNSSSRKECPSLTILHLNFLFKGAGARYWGDQRGGAWDQGLMGKTDQERNSQFCQQFLYIFSTCSLHHHSNIDNLVNIFFATWATFPCNLVNISLQLGSLQRWSIRGSLRSCRRQAASSSPLTSSSRTLVGRAKYIRWGDFFLFSF